MSFCALQKLSHQILRRYYDATGSVDVGAKIVVRQHRKSQEILIRSSGSIYFLWALQVVKFDSVNGIKIGQDCLQESEQVKKCHRSTIDLFLTFLAKLPMMYHTRRKISRMRRQISRGFTQISSKLKEYRRNFPYRIICLYKRSSL